MHIKHIKFLVFCLALLFPATSQGETLTPSTSCQISKGIYQENVTHLTNVISLINEFGSDKPTFLFKETKAKKEFVERIEALFDSYGITLQDHLAFAHDYKSEIDAYLSQHEELKQEIEDSRSQAEDLSLQYDQLLQSYSIRGVPETP
jgi:hypothetical protein